MQPNLAHGISLAGIAPGCDDLAATGRQCHVAVRRTGIEDQRAGRRVVIGTDAPGGKLGGVVKRRAPVVVPRAIGYLYKGFAEARPWGA